MANPTSQEAMRIFEELKKLLAGRDTVAVYMAIGWALAQMELLAKEPDRPEMFRIISAVMDDFIARARPH